MSELYDNLLKATNNIDDITTEKYATVTKLNGNYCDAKEEDTGLVHTNIPIVNGANLSVGDKAIIGFINNSIYDVVCYGALDKQIHDDSKQDLLVSGQNIKTINHTSLLGSGNIEIQGGGSDVDIVTSWEPTPSDTKVPSEKLTINTLDTKVDKVTGKGLSTNDFTNSYKNTIDGLSTVATTGDYDDLSGKPTIPSASTTTPSADTSSGSYGSGTSYARSNHTHPKSSLYAEATHNHTKSQITDFPTIPTKTSDLINDGDGSNAFLTQHQSLVDYVQKSSTSGLLKNDGTVDTSSYITSSALSNYVQKSNTTGLLKNDGTVDTTSYSTFSGSYNDLSNKPTIPTKISDLTNDSDFIEKSNTSGLVKNDGSIDTTSYLSSLPSHTHDDRYYTETEVDTALSGKQATLVSGTNVKTINNESILGSGNITIQGGSGGGGSYLNDFYGDSSTNELVIDYTNTTGSDIVTSWGSTLSDVKVPSEKLTKDSLDGKANSSHTHTKSQITDFPTTMTPSSHSHNITDLNNVTTVDVTVTYSNNTTETIKLLKYTGG